MAGASKKGFTEQQIREEYIYRAVARARWDFEAQVGIEVPITRGQIIVRGRMTTRGESKRADYVLFHEPNLPLAIIEAKDNSHPIGGRPLSTSWQRAASSSRSWRARSGRITAPSIRCVTSPLTGRC